MSDSLSLNGTDSYTWFVAGQNQRGVIQDAMRHIEEHTCVRFRQIEDDETYSDHHVLITKESLGFGQPSLQILNHYALLKCTM